MSASDLYQKGREPPMDENVTAVVPAYNEGERIVQTITALKNIGCITEIIAIDDGSKDNTMEVLQNCHGIKVIQNPVNKGKGYAVRAAMIYVTNPYVLLVDGDLCSSAAELKKLAEHDKISPKTMLAAVYPKPLKKGGFGMVKKLAGGSLHMLCRRSSASVLSGQRLIYADFLREIQLPDRFGLEFKITLEALRRNMDIIDVPLEIRHRETGRDLQGFVHRGRQFINILRVVVGELMPWN